MENIEIIIGTKLHHSEIAEDVFNEFIDWLQEKFERYGIPENMGDYIYYDYKVVKE